MAAIAAALLLHVYGFAWLSGGLNILRLKIDAHRDDESAHREDGHSHSQEISIGSASHRCGQSDEPAESDDSTQKDQPTA